MLKRNKKKLISSPSLEIYPVKGRVRIVHLQVCQATFSFVRKNFRVSSSVPPTSSSLLVDLLCTLATNVTMHDHARL